MSRGLLLGECRAALPLIDELEYDVVLLRVLKRPSDSTVELNTCEQLTLAIWEWLIHLGFVTDGQRYSLISKMDCELLTWSSLLDRAADKGTDKAKWPGLLLTLGDQQWATWQGYRRWYNFVYDREEPVVVKPHITTVTGNVTAMYLRLWERVEERRRQHA